MLIEAILIGTVTVTSYRPIPEQTKPECRGRNECRTSIGENVSELGVAVSQDLLASGKVHYLDVLFVPGFGYRVVFDTMHPRIHDAIDLLVYTKKEEKAVGVRHLPVWVIHTPFPLTKKGARRHVRELPDKRDHAAKEPAEAKPARRVPEEQEGGQAAKKDSEAKTH